MAITAKTRDAEIQDAFQDHEAVLKRFDAIKKIANAADAERDRLRDYIRDVIPAGAHGKASLAFAESSERIYANSEGNYYLEQAFIAEVTGSRQPIIPYHEYKLHDKDGKVVATLRSIDNLDLYTKKGSVTIKLVIQGA